MQKDDINRGVRYYQKALTEARKCRDMNLQCEILTELGNIGYDSKVRKSYIMQAMTIATNTNNALCKATDMNYLAKCLYSEKDFDSAMITLSDCDEYARITDNKEVLLDNSLLRSKIYEAKGKNDMLLAELKHYIELKNNRDEEIHIEQFVNTVNGIQLADILIPKEKYSSSTESTKQPGIILISVILFFSFILLLALFLFRKQYNSLKERKNAIEDELKATNEKLDKTEEDLNESRSKTLYFYQMQVGRNAIIDNVNTMIHKCYNLDPEKTALNLKKIASYISQFHDPLNRCKEKNRVIKENLELKKRIKKRFPDITKTQMEIIVYLRAGMSSKEIAMIMGLQTKTVEVHRSNIRKVLGLDPAENINTFLQRI